MTFRDGMFLWSNYVHLHTTTFVFMRWNSSFRITTTTTTTTTTIIIIKSKRKIHTAGDVVDHVRLVHHPRTPFSEQLT